MKEMKFVFSLDEYERIEEISTYNHNFFRIKAYGDWCSFYDNNILLEHTDEAYGTCDYIIGHFTDDKISADSFVPVVSVSVSSNDEIIKEG